MFQTIVRLSQQDPQYQRFQLQAKMFVHGVRTGVYDEQPLTYREGLDRAAIAERLEIALGMRHFRTLGDMHLERVSNF